MKNSNYYKITIFLLYNYVGGNMKIRIVDYNEIDKIYPLYILGYNYHNIGAPDYFPYSTEEQLKNNLEFNMHCYNKIYLLIELRNIPIGYACISFKITNVKSLWINELYIKEEYQKQGYGKKIMNEIESLAYQNDCKKVELNCWSFNSNAYEFYKHIGFINQRVVLEKELL